MNLSRRFFPAALFWGMYLWTVSAFAQVQQNPSSAPLSALCSPAFAQVDLDINNVRTRLLMGGDMWWNLVSAQYEVPKGSGKHSIFCGSIWMGGLDAGGQLHVAAMTYRQSGVDFWPGPLDTVNASTEDTNCRAFDKIWKLNRAEVQAFLDNRNNPLYVIPENILTWPGNGNAAEGQAHYLAPFRDTDGDGIYNPLNGDYPAFAFGDQQNCNGDLLGDQSLWWVFNDKGAQHSETGGEAFGVEIHAQAFAYQTNDEINDATFYQYKIINRSLNSYNQVYFGSWCDNDLGAYNDDYVGCDVSRGMGYAYNGDTADGSSINPQPGTYGLHPPALGIDFLQGPVATPSDGKDNDRDGTTDEWEERIPMSHFKYYGGSPPTDNPTSAIEFYYYLTGYWQDGTPQTYGDYAYGGTLPADFMFPGSSDPLGWGTNGIVMPPWSEVTENYIPGDRRFLVSAGPFSMQPGEVQFITTGVLWARDMNGDNLDAIAKLQQVSDKAQQLFDNCFDLGCSSEPAPSFTSTPMSHDALLFACLTEGNAWHWDFGDGTNSNARSPIHRYAAPGDYIVCLTVTNTCGTQTVCDTVTATMYVHECGPQITRIEGQGSGLQQLVFTQASIDSVFISPQHRVLHPVYEEMHGPVKIIVEDFLNLKNGDYFLAFDDTSMSAGWKLYIAGETDTVFSGNAISTGSRQHIPEWGIAVEIQQVQSPGLNLNPVNNGFLGATMTFSDPAKNWLTGLPDEDGYIRENWIRAGSDAGISTPDPCTGAAGDMVPIDPDEHFERILGGTWAPFRVAAIPDVSNCFEGPGAYGYIPTLNKIANLASVEIVITSDTSKWSRSCVFETGINTGLTEGGQRPLHLRAAASVDKLGQPDNSGTTGMGWFPGYAVNLETGERLNIAFGEASDLAGYNGRDMLWNPAGGALYNPLDGTRWWGGKHYVYVVGHNGDTYYSSSMPGGLANQRKDMPRYDSCKAMYKIMTSSSAFTPAQNVSEAREVYNDLMWTSIPLLNPGHQFLESDVTIRLHAAKPYRKFNTAVTPLNNDNPLYKFTIDKHSFDCNIYEGDANLFPNPFKDEATLWFENKEGLSYELAIYDLNGKLVRRYKDILTDRITIRRDFMSNGIYIYELSRNGETKTKGKFITY